jgi:hypothetical protein
VRIKLAGALVAAAAHSRVRRCDADVRATKRDAEVLRQKVATINAEAEKPNQAGPSDDGDRKRGKRVPRYDAGKQIPVGVVEPSVSILGTGRLSGRAVVDLDAVRKQHNPTSLLDPMNYLSGRLPVSATGVLTTSQGKGRFQLESAYISSIPVPKLLLQEIVSYYSKTAESPAGINIDDPFELPAKIREIRVERGQAIVVQ